MAVKTDRQTQQTLWRQVACSTRQTTRCSEFSPPDFCDVVWCFVVTHHIQGVLGLNCWKTASLVEVFCGFCEASHEDAGWCSRYKTSHPQNMYNWNVIVRQALLPFSFRIILCLCYGESSKLLYTFGWLWLCCLSDEIDLKCVLWGTYSCNLLEDLTVEGVATIRKTEHMHCDSSPTDVSVGVVHLRAIPCAAAVPQFLACHHWL